jgi:ArsR family transcriptional regulator
VKVGRALEQLLPYFKALSDQQRVNIVRLLLEREHCVCELVEKLGLSQSTVSHHIKILKEIGLLNDRRRGTWNYYSINKNGFQRYASILDEKLFQPVSKSVFKECPSFNKGC